MQQTLLVNEEFVIEAHKAACSEWKKRIEEKFPILFSEIDRIKESQEYKDYVATTATTLHDISILKEGNEIFIRLPIANSDWAFAAFDLAKYICKTYDYYPYTGEFLKKSDGRDTLWLALKKKGT